MTSNPPSRMRPVADVEHTYVAGDLYMQVNNHEVVRTPALGHLSAEPRSSRINKLKAWGGGIIVAVTLLTASLELSDTIIDVFGTGNASQISTVELTPQYNCLDERRKAYELYELAPNILIPVDGPVQEQCNINDYIDRVRESAELEPSPDGEG